jgi:hypothetical protein
MNTKQSLVAALCLLAIAGSAWWIFHNQFRTPKFNVVLHQAIGQIMAEETARLLNHTGEVVVVAIETARFPELQAQLDEFGKILKQSSHIKIEETYKLETDNKPKYGVGSGLSGRRYVRIVNKKPAAAAIVSFVGAPDLSEDDIAQLKYQPKFIAESRSVEGLKKLFEKRFIHAAVVSRFQFPTPVKDTPRTRREWFDKRFQVVTAESAASLPASAE